MTESQKRFLTSYLGECWIEHDNPNQLIYSRQSYLDKSALVNRTFTNAQDKQDLLEKMIEKGEFHFFCIGTFGDWYFHNVWAKKLENGEDVSDDFFSDFIKLSPINTAELICKWKGVE